MKIAVVQAMCGHTTVIGPDDYDAVTYNGQMDAAICWHIEAGYEPAAKYWVEVDLPEVPEIPTINGKTTTPQ